MGRLAVPYARVAVPGLLVVVGFVLLIELCSFLTIGASQGKTFTLAHTTIDPRSAAPWLIGALLLVGGGAWLWREGGRVRAAWDAVMEEIKAAAARA
jgi:branched-chain amino acid transport system permease protein